MFLHFWVPRFAYLRNGWQQRYSQCLSDGKMKLVPVRRLEQLPACRKPVETWAGYIAVNVEWVGSIAGP